MIIHSGIFKCNAQNKRDQKMLFYNIFKYINETYSFKSEVIQWNSQYWFPLMQELGKIWREGGR